MNDLTKKFDDLKCQNENYEWTTWSSADKPDAKDGNDNETLSRHIALNYR